jgi:hypothetical protein
MAMWSVLGNLIAEDKNGGTWLSQVIKHCDLNKLVLLLLFLEKEDYGMWCVLDDDIS